MSRHGDHDDPSRALRLALAGQLAAGGALADPRWRAAVEEVPRHLFVPAYWRLDARGRPVHVERGTRGWLEGAYADAALTVQMTDGVATSSSTAPSLMLRMLEALDVEESSQVQEIGTGTGYNTALLCHRLPAEQVASVEVDPHLAAGAAERLLRLGMRPRLRVADATDADAGGRPFDRLIATCALPALPPAWLTQGAPGALLVVPVGAGVVRLRLRHEGVAEGRFLPFAAFFMAARAAGTTGAVPYPGTPSAPEERRTGLSPQDAADDGFAFVCSVALPATTWSRTQGLDGGVASVRMWDAAGSWADVAGGVVRQAGPVHLWDRVEELWADVTAADGRPPVRERYGMTAAPNGSHVWLDEPSRTLFSL